MRASILPKRYLNLEWLGMIFTLLMGTLSHFAYKLSGYSGVAALFCATSESTWEHMKLLFFPYVLYAILEYVFIPCKKYVPNYITAKGCGVVSGLISIPLLFYGYTTVLGRNYFVIDIAIFICSVVLSYGISYLLLNHPAINFNGLFLTILVVLAMFFGLFTFFPPSDALFTPPSTFG